MDPSEADTDSCRKTNGVLANKGCRKKNMLQKRLCRTTKLCRKQMYCRIRNHTHELVCTKTIGKIDI